MREGQSLKSADWLVGIRKAGAREFCEAMGFTSLNPSYARNNTATGELLSIHPGSCLGQAFAGTCARCRNKDGTRADGGAGGWHQSHFFACNLARFRSRRG